ncbi:MAG: T9SS type A sorting domain-containing protein [Bacteroidales bacterium]|nr:T9SS type A sorting domain-containing protein [Bacteroidales bacterium]
MKKSFILQITLMVFILSSIADNTLAQEINYLNEVYNLINEKPNITLFRQKSQNLTNSIFLLDSVCSKTSYGFTEVYGIRRLNYSTMNELLSDSIISYYSDNHSLAEKTFHYYADGKIKRTIVADRHTSHDQNICYRYDSTFFYKEGKIEMVLNKEFNSSTDSSLNTIRKIIFKKQGNILYKDEIIHEGVMVHTLKHEIIENNNSFVINSFRNTNLGGDFISDTALWPKIRVDTVFYDTTLNKITIVKYPFLKVNSSNSYLSREDINNTVKITQQYSEEGSLLHESIARWIPIEEKWEEWAYVENSYNDLGDIELQTKTFYDDRTLQWTLFEERVYYYGYNTSNINRIQTETIKIYPNPATQNIYFKGIFNLKEFCIYNVTGQTVLSGNSDGNSIDISKLKSGIYFIKINSDKTIYTSRFLKL